MVCAILPQHLVEGRAAGDPAAAPRRGTGHQRSFHRTLTGTDRRRSSRRSSSREGPPTILVFDGDRRCGARAWNLSVGAHVLAAGRGAGFDGDLRSGWRTRNPFGGERGFDGDGRCGVRARNRSCDGNLSSFSWQKIKGGRRGIRNSIRKQTKIKMKGQHTDSPPAQRSRGLHLQMSARQRSFQRSLPAFADVDVDAGAPLGDPPTEPRERERRRTKSTAVERAEVEGRAAGDPPAEPR